MKKRVSNDIKIEWTVLRNEIAEDFTDATNIKLVARIVNSKDIDITEYSEREDNLFRIRIPASALNIGTYTLILTYQKPDVTIAGGLSTHGVDVKNAFEIVRSSEQEDDEGKDITSDAHYAVDGATFTPTIIIQGDDIILSWSNNKGLINPADRILNEGIPDAVLAANNAADLANTKAGLADEKATAANNAATLANEKAGYANTQGDFAKEQGELAQTARENIEGDLSLKIDKSSITSELGDSEELVVSQKGVAERLALKADLVDGTVPAEQLPPELVDTTLYVTNVAHRKRRIKDASEVEDSSASWILVKGNDYLKALPDILGLGLYLVSQDLTEHKKLSKTNSNFYADGSPAALDGSEGDIQMCWRKPIYIKYYEKQETDGLYENFEISHLNILGECEMIPPGGGFPAVLDRTTTTLRALYSTDANYRGGNNASAYDADPLKTLLGKPASNLSAYTSELYAKKRGDLWTSGGTPFFATLAILQIMFFGTNNSQAAIVSDDLLVDGAGFQRSKIATEGLFEGSFGVNNAFPNWDTYNAYNPTFDLSAGFEHGDITGRRVYTIPDWPTVGTTQTIQLAYFFGMPWPFNHMWYGDAHQRVDQQTVEQGFKTVVYQKRDITTAPISGGPSSNGVIPPAPWEKVAEAYRSNGYIRRVSWNGLSMIPTEAGGAGGTSTFYCDYLYNNGETSFGWRAPLRFAVLNYGSAAGAFYVYVNVTPTSANAGYGAFCCHFTEGIAPRKIEK